MRTQVQRLVCLSAIAPALLSLGKLSCLCVQADAVLAEDADEPVAKTISSSRKRTAAAEGKGGKENTTVRTCKRASKKTRR